MSEKKNTREQEFSRQVKKKESLKLKAQRRTVKGIWFGFGTFGLIGWSIVAPTLIGTILGIWLDKKFPGTHSWTLMLMVTGLFLGCLNAWHWIDKENKQIQKEQEEKNE
jgi:ATP synthase protein I